MVYQYVQDNDNGLTIIQVSLIVKSLWYVMIGLGFNSCFVIGAPWLNGVHGYEFSSSVGHLSSNLVGLLVYDCTFTYLRHQPCITSPSGQRQPYLEWFNILGTLYDIELWHDSCYKHVLFLYCIHEYPMKCEVMIAPWCMWFIY
jgi:hypothetical protein